MHIQHSKYNALHFSTKTTRFYHEDYLEISNNSTWHLKPFRLKLNTTQLGDVSIMSCAIQFLLLKSVILFFLFSF